MAYVPRMGEQRPRVFIGHARAKISFYCMDECESTDVYVYMYYNTQWNTTTYTGKTLWFAGCLAAFGI